MPPEAIAKGQSPDASESRIDSLLRRFCTHGGAAIAVLVMLAAQLGFGTTRGQEGPYVLDRPYYEDQLYYAGLARVVIESFPPDNPTFAGTRLRQHAYHLLPLSLLGKMMSPYLAMRLLNAAYCLLILWLLRRYFPRSYGAIACALFIASPPYFAFGSLSIDLATRGFHHAPFVALALVAMCETRRSKVRIVSAFLLPFVHALMAVGFAPGLLLAMGRQNRRAAGAFLLGLAVVAGLAATGGGRSVAGFLWEVLGFYPHEPLYHLVPLGVALFFVRPGAATLGVLGAALITAATPWNRFYFIFAMAFMLALVVGAALTTGRRWQRLLVGSALLGAMAFYVAIPAREAIEARPFEGRHVAPALVWIDRETPRDAVFLQGPTLLPWSADQRMYRELGWGHWVIEVRNLHCGASGWADSVGLKGTERNAAVERYFRGLEPLPAGVDFVFYGPMERLAFPRYDPCGLERVYDENLVQIYRARHERPRDRDRTGPN